MSNWVETYHQLRKAREQYRKDAPRMTEYERIVHNRAYNEVKDKEYPGILAGARQLMSGAIGRYQSSQRIMAGARRAELARWDSGKLADEMRLSESLVSTALKLGNNPFTGENVTDRLEGILKDALESRDIHKSRGACEVLKAALAGVAASGASQEVRLKANKLAREAEAALEDMRLTPEMIEASAALSQSTDELLEVREQVCQVSEFLDGIRADNPLSSSPFGYLVRQVGRERGGVVIYPPESEQVTGVVRMVGV